MTVAEEVVLLLLSWQYIHPALRRYGDHDVGRVWWWWFRLLRRLFINNASQWETTDDDNINNMTERDKANNFMMPPKRIILSWYGLDATFMTLGRNWGNGGGGVAVYRILVEVDLERCRFRSMACNLRFAVRRCCHHIIIVLILLQFEVEAGW